MKAQDDDDELFRKSYPIAVFQDRYGGTYSGGEWIAVAQAFDKPFKHTKERRLEYAYEGTHGSDVEAMDFRITIKEIPWIAVGDTPDEAVEHLLHKLKVEMTHWQERDLNDVA